MSDSRTPHDASVRDPAAFETLLVHAGQAGRRHDGAVVTPIFQSATYEYRGEAGETLRYLRYNNSPNQEELHRKVAVLEGADDALVAASGMAAISTAMLSVLGCGDHLAVQDTLYGGTATFVDRELPRFGITVDRFDARRPDSLDAVLKPETRAVYTEALSNPLVQVADHEAIVARCRERGLVSMIDSTFATPFNFRPIDHGYDLVLHSATKYLNGHSDLVAGVVAGRRDLVDGVSRVAKSLGASLDPHACFLLDRGLKTLALRMAGHNANALRLAKFLDGHPAVSRVHHPGLRHHPDHERAARLFRGAGGVLAFELQGGAAAAERLLARLAIMIVAPSLGGVETLVSRPANTSHAGLSAAERRALGIADGLVRVSVGVENADDLIADLEQALATDSSAS